MTSRLLDNKPLKAWGQYSYNKSTSYQRATMRLWALMLNQATQHWGGGAVPVLHGSI